MLSRLIVAFIIFFATTLSASGAPLYPLDDLSLLESVKELKQKNYTGAKDLALKAQETPIRNFILGVSLYRLERWDDAAESLAKSLEGFGLLGDYSLYYRADSLFRLGRYDEAIEALQKLKKDYPASPLIKAASSLHADTLFHKKDFTGALVACQKYVESHPSGSKALEAIFHAALCREALGDKEKAVSELRRIWLKYPGSPVASLAESNLLRLKAENVPVPPYTAEEIFKRGIILYDLQKYRRALETFRSIEEKTLPESFRLRLDLKIARTLFKSRRYHEAEQTLSALSALDDKEIACDASYWLARTLDRTGRELQAVKLYRKVAASFPQSELADDSLFLAALIRKYRGEYGEAVSLLEKLVSHYPSSSLVSIALWEGAWNRYLAKDLRGAADSLNRLLENPAYREKALYWFGKTQEASGEKEIARQTFVRLVEEYPFGFYAAIYKKGSGLKNDQFPVLGNETIASIPVPAGYERVKALATLGMTDEAAMELSACKKKVAGRSKFLEIARLYWEIQDYRSAMGLFRKLDRDSSLAWSFSYPRAFREHVSLNAVNFGIPESLAYSVIRAESSFSPAILSPAGAVGLMQVMPATAKFLHKDKSGKIDASQLTHPELNINLGMKHMQDLIKRYEGNLIFAIAAYNSGATPVDRWRRSFPGLQNDEFIENIPYPETREYVKKVLTNMEIYKSLYKLDECAEKTSATTLEKTISPTAGLAASSTEIRETPAIN